MASMRICSRPLLLTGFRARRRLRGTGKHGFLGCIRRSRRRALRIHAALGQELINEQIRDVIAYLRAININERIRSK